MVHIFHSLRIASCTGSGTHGPALQLGPKKLADALILDSVNERSGSHPRATNVDSKYCKTKTVILFLS